jgi:hypothetical protein
MVLLCLIAALSGTPLRQAEAASDFARACAALLDSSGTIVLPDGGVGDDRGETTLRGDGSPDVVSLPNWCWDRLAEIDAPPLAVIPLPAQPVRSSFPHRRGRAIWLPSDANQRHAWLQLFLI